MDEGAHEPTRESFVGPPEPPEWWPSESDFVGPPEQPTPWFAASSRRLAVSAVLAGFVLLLALGVLREDTPTGRLDDLLRGGRADSTVEPSDGVDPATGGTVDAEQAAFLEEAMPPALDESLARLAAEREEAQRVADFTDLDTIERLAGSWTLDLGYEGRVDVGFDTRPLRTVARDRWDVTLFGLAGPVEAPFYSVLQLPDGRRLLAFLDAEGRFLRVLDRLSVGEDVMTFTLAGSRQRHQGFRRGGAGRAMDAGPNDLDEPGGRESEVAEGRPESSDPVRIETTRRSPRVLWEEARRLRRTGRFHTLRTVLDQLLRAEPGHRRARSWREEVDDWIEDQEADLRDDVVEHLEDLADALAERQPRRAFRLWRDADPRTRQRIRSIVERSRDLEIRVRVLGLSVRDGTAAFDVLLVVESRDTRRQTSIEEIRWEGRYERGDFTVGLP